MIKQDHRRYVRMDTVFPVEFHILDEERRDLPGPILQGFTRDLSEGGLCLELKSFGKTTEEKLTRKDLRIRLVINPAFSSDPIQAVARVVWLKRTDGPTFTRYLIGVEYEAIDPGQRVRLIRHAKKMRRLPRVVFLLFLLLAGSLAGIWLNNQLLVNENRRLVSDLRNSAKAKSEISEGLLALEDRRISLEQELSDQKKDYAQLEKSLAETDEAMRKLKEQNVALGSDMVDLRSTYEKDLTASRDRESLIRAQLSQIQRNKQDLKRSYDSIQASNQKGSQAAMRLMIGWLVSHQNQRTGLIASYEGDSEQRETAYTYDQALACQAFLIQGHEDRARAILDFYQTRAKRAGDAFYNAYDSFGGQPIETTVHAGPNLWIAIAALQYDHQIGGERYLPLAKQIAYWTMRYRDEEGGLKGGPGIAWYSTEHNLDAYALFGMLYEVTGDENYRAAQKKTLEWLKKYAYSHPGGGINRGKGDSTIATDTFGWSIASVGPAMLKATGFEPEDIMNFAEANCLVTADFQRPGGKAIKVSGFDFAKAKNLGRGGVVSTEWTAQMVVSYRVLAKYLESISESEKAAAYLQKADLYLSELEKMIITSPSPTGQGRGCLPYASADNVDTGHGWRTPHGATTGSVAGTAYGLFAWLGYNPFELNKS